MTAKTEIDEIAEKIVGIRKKPLLVLYWHDHDECVVLEDNAKTVYKEMRKHLCEPIDDIDVIIHCNGGSTHESYMVAKSIRELANTVTFMIPEYAYSGGTMIALSGNEILFGHCAVISPIDPQLKRGCGENDGDSSTYPIHFVRFVKNTAETLDKDRKTPTNIENIMIDKLISEFGAEDLANVYRMSGMSKWYAHQLLKYSFPRLEQADDRDEIANTLCDDMNSHSMKIDCDSARILGLPATKMSFELSDLSKELVEKLYELGESYEICGLMKDDVSRDLFVKYYPVKQESNSSES